MTMAHLHHNLPGERWYIHDRLKEIGLWTVTSSTSSSTDDSRSVRSRDPSVKINSSWSPPSSQPCIVHPPSSSSPHPRACYTTLRGHPDPEWFWHELSLLHLEASNTSTRLTYGLASWSCCLFIAKSWQSCGLSLKAGCRTLSSDTPVPSSNACKCGINSWTVSMDTVVYHEHSIVTLI